MFVTDDLTTAEAAVRYASLGVPVLALYEIRPDGTCACGRGDCGTRAGKHPRTRNGHLGASSDPDTVARWWRWWPRANVGAATGGLFDVWDIDLPPADAEAIIRRHAVDSLSPRVRTGSGGTHVYVAPTGHGNRGKFLPGCDWRGQGGYVVLPPSIHLSGKRYAWLPDTTPSMGDGVTLPPGSDPLLEALAAQQARATPARAWHASSASPYAAAALRRECATLAAMPRDSGRNHTLNTAAFNMGQLVAEGVLIERDAVAQLRDAALRCGLGERETDRTIASGIAAGKRNPRRRRGAA